MFSTIVKNTSLTDNISVVYVKLIKFLCTDFLNYLIIRRAYVKPVFYAR